MDAERENTTRVAAAPLVNEKACVSYAQEGFGAREHLVPCSSATVNEHYCAVIRSARRKKPALQRNSVRSVDRHFLPGGIALSGHFSRTMRVDLDVLTYEVAVYG